MFRENDKHRQRSFMSGIAWMPEKLQQRLQGSWAETFYTEVFCRIDEQIFAELYSEEASRPNIPVNVLASVEILKSGFGWSDEELHEQVCFNLQVRHALGLDDLRVDIFTLRTQYNFRRRIREYEERTGMNLMGKVFEQVTDDHLEKVKIQTGWQRMDSTQMLSNLAEWSRLELLVGVVQHVYRHLPTEMQARWQERLAPYLEGRPHQVCHRIAVADQEAHMQQLGEVLSELEAMVTEEAPEHEGLPLLRRVLNEQFEVTNDGSPTLRSPEDVAASSLQSPHDPDATYRVKSGKRYRGGYVVNISETADPANKVQLITDVQLEPNTTDDTQLMKQALEGQQDRGVEVERLTTDGGYTGPTGEQICKDYKVELRATRLRGGKSTGEQWGWEAYHWEQDEEGLPIHVTCPQGETAEVQPGRGKDRFFARFAKSSCENCPFRDTRCHIRWGSRVGPTLYVTQRAVEVAVQRQRLCPEDASLRTIVEASVREVKHPFPGGKLPVRGLIRSRMMIYGSALMTNLRRLHRYFISNGDKLHSEASDLGTSTSSTLHSCLQTWFIGLQRRFAPLRRSFASLAPGAC